MTAIGGLVAPLGDAADQGLLLTLGSGNEAVRAPIAPGLYANVRVAASRTIEFGEEVTVTGPGVLAFDGERERVLKPDQRARSDGATRRTVGDRRSARRWRGPPSPARSEFTLET